MSVDRDHCLANSLLEFARERGGSVRLTNALRVALTKELMPYETVGEYLKGGYRAELAFSKVPAVGRKTIRELSMMLASFAPQRGLEFERESGNDSPVKEEVQAYPELLSALPERQLLVIGERYGLNGQSQSTLEEIGRRLDVTRERVRQIEAKTVRALRVRHSRQIRRYLHEREFELWEAVCSGTGFVRRDEKAQAKLRLSAVDRLAIDVVHGTLDFWLATVAKDTLWGWLSNELDISTVEQIREEIELILDRGRTPIPCALAAGWLGVDERALRVALRFGTGAAEYLGYVVRTPLGSRRRRTVRLHRQMCADAPQAPISMLVLKRKYLEIHSDDPCSARDMQIVMSEAPHLFLNMYEEGWASLNSFALDSNAAEIPEDTSEQPAAEEVAGTQGDATISSILAGILLSHGPMSFDELRQRFLSLTSGAYSKSSVGPILIMGERFVRIAPGVYGLREHLSQAKTMAKAAEILYAPKHLAIYCQARWAGEPMGTYPLWSPAMEKAWAVWAKDSGLDSILHSLLVIASIEDWDVGESERERWMRIRRSSGRYSLEDRIDVPIDETMPSLSEIVACCLQARQRNGISWISVNRVCGQRVDDRHSHTSLAILISMGIVTAPNHWQKWHSLTGEASKAIDRLVYFLESSSDGHWKREIVEYVFDLAAVIRERGWLGVMDQGRLLDALTLSSETVDEETVSEQPVDLEGLIKKSQKMRALRDSGLLEQS